MNEQSGPWGPDGRRAAVCVTFDHLGEAAELQAGLIPADTPRGRHRSAVHDLPLILDLLRARGLSTTFYIEALNCELYPESLYSIVGDGHSLGWHGWWNEPTYKLPTREAPEVLERTMAAFEGLGLRPTGARPPGGLLGEHTIDLFRAAGFGHLSLAGAGFGLCDGLPLLPFAWADVDGCYYFEQFAPLGLPPRQRPTGPQGLVDAYRRRIEQTVAAGSCTSFVCHVPWTDRQERLGVIAEVIDALMADDRVWLTSPDDLAQWMVGHPSDFPAIVHHDQPPAW